MSVDMEHEKFNGASDKLLEVDQLLMELLGHARELVENSDLEAIPYDLDRQVRELLSEEGLKELCKRTRQAARLRILEAAGLCLKGTPYVRFIDVHFFGKLSVWEIETLYRPVESSTVLKVLTVGDNLNYLKPASWQLLADIFLGATKLESFSCYNLAGLSHIAEAVTASGRRTLALRVLVLGYQSPRPDRAQMSRANTKSLKTESAGNSTTLIHAAPGLEKLVLVNLQLLPDADGAELIGQAIASHQTLQSLTIGEKLDVDATNRGGTGAHPFSTEESKTGCIGRLLSGAFLGLPRNTSIQYLKLHVWKTPRKDQPRNPRLQRDFEVLAEVLQIGIAKLHLRGINVIPAGDLRGFLGKLQARAQLVSLTLRQDAREEEEGMGFDADAFAMLVEVVKSNSIPSLKHLNLYIRTPVLLDFDWPSFYAALQQNSAIESLKIVGPVGSPNARREIPKYIQTTKTLQKLSLSGFKLMEEISWRSIFRSLRDNTSIRVLEIKGDSLDDDAAYWELMAMLQVNSTLQEVEFVGLRNERMAKVQEALRCKARQESYLAELRRGLGQLQGQEKWQSPRCGRIFLCGSPNAGKTRLTHTMLKLAKGKREILADKVLRRTEGIEIHSLRNDDEMQIVVWDLAGQDIFRALQESLFPRLSRASVFIFVFSPMEKDGKLKPKIELGKMIEKEFVEWLKFIASNSAVTGFNLPQVLVVISHKDKCNPDQLPIKWCETILERLMKDFKDVIQIHPNPYFINSHKSQQVQPIVNELYRTFDQLLKEKLFKVPLACSHMSQELVKWASAHEKEPVIDEPTFFSVCGNIRDLQVFTQNIDEDANKKVLKAVGSYLHDVGTVIDLTTASVMEECEEPKRNLMVVNTNWLTHVFLGSLFCYRHDFQLARGEGVKWAESVDGFLSETEFQQLLLEGVWEPMKKQFPTLSPGMLQDIMKHLDLLYVIQKVDDSDGETGSRYFVPTFFQSKIDQTLQWDATTFQDLERGKQISFLGVRLRCKDRKRTYLSPAFFSRFQVTIWNILMEQLQLTPVIGCKFNFISILVDAFDIRIEKDRDGDFIDILIRSPKSRRMMWDFVEKHIVEQLRAFCASPKGCPGVELVMDIIRTQCVQRLTSCVYRKNQSVAKEELKRQLIDSIQKPGPIPEEGDLYSHTWSGVPEAGLGAACEDALQLLPPADLKDVRAGIMERTRLLQDRVDKLKDMIREIDDSPELAPIGAVSTKVKEKKKLEMSMPQQWISPNERRIEDLIQRNHIDLKGDVGEIGKDVKEVLAQVRALKLEIQEMNHLQQREAEEVAHMHQKLDQLTGNSMSTSQWPKRPYFTQKDVSVSQWITATVNIGKPLMLHFECEGEGMSHIVPEQPGYGITVVQENYEVLRQISKTSVQVLWYSLKAGLHIATGMGDLVPELQTSDRNTTLSMARLLHKVQIQDARTSKQALRTCSPEEAWRYLQNFLESHLKSQITEYFLLHPAEYSDGQSTRAWLCQECLEKGLKTSKIRK